VFFATFCKELTHYGGMPRGDGCLGEWFVASALVA
jgi:hypothetical protein